MTQKARSITASVLSLFAVGALFGGLCHVWRAPADAVYEEEQYLQLKGMLIFGIVLVFLLHGLYLLFKRLFVAILLRLFGDSRARPDSTAT